MIRVYVDHDIIIEIKTFLPFDHYEYLMIVRTDQNDHMVQFGRTTIERRRTSYWIEFTTELKAVEFKLTYL